MPKFVIERAVKGVGASPVEALKEMSRTSCNALDSMPHVQWVHSYVTPDKIYCVYIAPDADAVREHARRAGFPADPVSRIQAIIDPTWAE